MSRELGADHALNARECDVAAGVENLPEPAECAEGFGCEEIEGVVEGDDADADAGGGPSREMNQRGEGDHGPAERPDEQARVFLPRDGEGPSGPMNPSEFESDERESSRHEELGEFAL